MRECVSYNVRVCTHSSHIMYIGIILYLIVKCVRVCLHVSVCGFERVYVRACVRACDSFLCRCLRVYVNAYVCARKCSCESTCVRV